MKNISKNLIISGFAVLAILALGAIALVPSQADAYMVYGQYASYQGGPLPELHPMPGINRINPEKVYADQGSQIIEIRGSGFVYDSIAQLDGYARPTQYIDKNRLLMRLSSADLRQVGDHLITVVNPTPGGGVSHPEILEVHPASGDISSIQYVDDYTYRNGQGDNFFYEDSYSFNSDSNYGRSLGASAINSRTFFPSTFMQWLAFAILVLLIVIIWRRLYRKKDEEEPLKKA